nr:hemolysin III family protein [Halothermothrix orenii]
MIRIKKEEKISFYSHFVGFILAVLGTIYLIYITEGPSLKIVSTIYGISTMVLFLASSLYHANKKYDGETSIWRKLDHIAIFIMIAGTYTPVTFIYLSGYWKWSIIIIQWALVFGDSFLNSFT